MFYNCTINLFKSIKNIFCLIFLCSYIFTTHHTYLSYLLFTEQKVYPYSI